jgi:hypothetical protein
MVFMVRADRNPHGLAEPARRAIRHFLSGREAFSEL